MTTPALPETPVTQSSGSTAVEERTDYRYDAGDQDRFSHYAPKDKIMEAMILGTPIKALCGKMWVPSRDPKRFPVCPACKEIYESDRFYDGPSDNPGE